MSISTFTNPSGGKSAPRRFGIESCTTPYATWLNPGLSAALFSTAANRLGKGTHRAVDRLQQFARRYRYVLRLDIVQHFPSIDHQMLLAILGQTIHNDEVVWLVETILASGAGILDPTLSLPRRPKPRGPKASVSFLPKNVSM
jgi:hypothetical protein